jgi:hypothetical protein
LTFDAAMIPATDPSQPLLNAWTIIVRPGNYTTAGNIMPRNLSIFFEPGAILTYVAGPVAQPVFTIGFHTFIIDGDGIINFSGVPFLDSVVGSTLNAKIHLFELNGTSSTPLEAIKRPSATRIEPRKTLPVVSANSKLKIAPLPDNPAIFISQQGWIIFDIDVITINNQQLLETNSESECTIYFRSKQLTVQSSDATQDLGYVVKLAGPNTLYYEVDQSVTNASSFFMNIGEGSEIFFNCQNIALASANGNSGFFLNNSPFTTAKGQISHLDSGNSGALQLIDSSTTLEIKSIISLASPTINVIFNTTGNIVDLIVDRLSAFAGVAIQSSYLLPTLDQGTYFSYRGDSIEANQGFNINGNVSLNISKILASEIGLLISKTGSVACPNVIKGRIGDLVSTASEKIFPGITIFGGAGTGVSRVDLEIGSIVGFQTAIDDQAQSSSVVTPTSQNLYNFIINVIENCLIGAQFSNSVSISVNQLLNFVTGFSFGTPSPSFAFQQTFKTINAQTSQAGAILFNWTGDSGNLNGPPTPNTIDCYIESANLNLNDAIIFNQAQSQNGFGSNTTLTVRGQRVTSSIIVRLPNYTGGRYRESILVSGSVFNFDLARQTNSSTIGPVASADVFVPLNTFRGRYELIPIGTVSVPVALITNNSGLIFQDIVLVNQVNPPPFTTVDGGGKLTIYGSAQSNGGTDNTILYGVYSVTPLVI